VEGGNKIGFFFSTIGIDNEFDRFTINAYGFPTFYNHFVYTNYSYCAFIICFLMLTTVSVRKYLDLALSSPTLYHVLTRIEHSKDGFFKFEGFLHKCILAVCVRIFWIYSKYRLYF